MLYIENKKLLGEKSGKDIMKKKYCHKEVPEWDGII